MRKVCPRWTIRLIIASKKKLGSRICPYPNILLPKSHENPTKYVDTRTNFACLDHLGSVTLYDPKMTFTLGSHVFPYPNILLWKSHENLSKCMLSLPFLVNDLKWVLDDLWPHFCWGRTCAPTPISFCPSARNPSKYMETVSNFASFNIIAHAQCTSPLPRQLHSPLFPYKLGTTRTHQSIRAILVILLFFPFGSGFQHMTSTMQNLGLSVANTFCLNSSNLSLAASSSSAFFSPSDKVSGSLCSTVMVLKSSESPYKMNLFVFLIFNSSYKVCTSSGTLMPEAWKIKQRRWVSSQYYLIL